MVAAPEIQSHRSRERHEEYGQGKIYGFILCGARKSGFGSREDGHPLVRKEGGIASSGSTVWAETEDRTGQRRHGEEEGGRR
jgi:hypothetical protein